MLVYRLSDYIEIYSSFCGRIVFCNDNACILRSEYFFSQGYGLKKGGQKSSTTPKIVEPLEDIYVQEVACGYGHTLYIARDEETDLPFLSKLPVYDPDKVRVFFMSL